MLTESQAADVEKIGSLIEQVTAFENEVSLKAKSERESTPFPDPATECKPPRYDVSLRNISYKEM